MVAWQAGSKRWKRSWKVQQADLATGGIRLRGQSPKPAIPAIFKTWKQWWGLFSPSISNTDPHPAYLELLGNHMWWLFQISSPDTSDANLLNLQHYNLISVSVSVFLSLSGCTPMYFNFGFKVIYTISKYCFFYLVQLKVGLSSEYIWVHRA